MEVIRDHIESLNGQVRVEQLEAVGCGRSEIELGCQKKRRSELRTLYGSQPLASRSPIEKLKRGHECAAFVRSNPVEQAAPPAPTVHKVVCQCGQRRRRR